MELKYVLDIFNWSNSFNFSIKSISLLSNNLHIILSLLISKIFNSGVIIDKKSLLFTFLYKIIDFINISIAFEYKATENKINTILKNKT